MRGRNVHPSSGLVASLLAIVALATACGGASPAPSPGTPSSGATAEASGAPVSAKPAASAASSSAVVAVTVSYAQATSGFAPLYIAKESGFFQKNGLDASLKRVSGTAQVPALTAGEIQIAGLGGTEVTNVNLHGGNLVMLATVDDYPTFSLYAEKKYKSVQDLAGQGIGITTAGSSTDATAQLFLRHFKVQDKVKIVPSGSTMPGILAAMTKGLAAGILSPPITAEAEKQGYVELVNGYKLGEPLNTSGFTVTRPYLKDNGDTVRRFLRSYAQAWEYTANPANKPEVIKVLMKYTQSDAEISAIGYDAVLPVWQGKKVPNVDPQGIANILSLSSDPKAKDAKPSDSIDNSLIQAAVK